MADAQGRLSLELLSFCRVGSKPVRQLGCALPGDRNSIGEREHEQIERNMLFGQTPPIRVAQCREKRGIELGKLWHAPRSVDEGSARRLCAGSSAQRGRGSVFVPPQRRHPGTSTSSSSPRPQIGAHCNSLATRHFAEAPPGGNRPHALRAVSLTGRLIDDRIRARGRGED